MTKRFLVLLSLLAAGPGCSKYRSRAQAPSPTRPGVQSETINSPIGTGKASAPPQPPDSMILIPAAFQQRPSTITSDTPPSTPPSGVQQASGTEPDLLRESNMARPASPGTTATLPSRNPNLEALKSISQRATERWKGIDTYEAQLIRREAMGKEPPQTEEVLFLYRKKPMSIYMKNTGEVGRNREVIYNPGQFQDKLHVIVGEGDKGFPVGKKAPALSPDSPLVKMRSRHNIRDAGLGTPINHFAKLVAAMEAGRSPADTLISKGKVKRAEFGEAQLEAVEQTIRAGEDQSLPSGGIRQWYFDSTPNSPSFGLPILMILNEGNREVEYYCFLRFKAPANLTDADFDISRLGKK